MEEPIEVKTVKNKFREDFFIKFYHEKEFDDNNVLSRERFDELFDSIFAKHKNGAMEQINKEDHHLKESDKIDMVNRILMVKQFYDFIMNDISKEIDDNPQDYILPDRVSDLSWDGEKSVYDPLNKINNLNGGKKSRKGKGKGITRKRQSKAKCKKMTLKKYVTRPSPPYRAAMCVGQKKRGNDGFLYISKPGASFGPAKWIKV
jgi:hypothetical protein